MAKRFLLSAVLLAACSNSTDLTNETLTRVTAATTAACPDGGVSIGTGTDRNGNGVLDDYEILSSYNICNPATTVPLVTTTPLAAGDSHCPSGGTRLDVGTDSNGDGMLQPSEITSTQYICSSPAPTYPSNPTPPASPAGAFTMNAGGGAGAPDGGKGGDGGGVQLIIDDGTLGGQIAIFKTGVVDAGATMPTVIFDGGDVAMLVAHDTAIVAYSDATAGLASQDAFFALNDSPYLYKNVAGIATIVTGIDIAADKTLTLPINIHDSGAVVSVAHDVRNAGVITTGSVDSANASPLTMSCGNFIGVTGSNISLVGASGQQGTDGGDGGDLTLGFVGAFVNQGAIDASGGAGSVGGHGGRINISIASTGAGLFNSGAITSNGGASVAGDGASAGSITVLGFGELDNVGTLTSNGGDGRSAGGSAAQITLQMEQFGNVRNTGAVSANGGGCSDNACAAGPGAAVYIGTGGGGDVLNAGDISARGGEPSGDGGQISFNNRDSDGSFNENVGTPTGSIRVSGNLDVGGGSGGAIGSGRGGSGGSINAELTVGIAPMGQAIEFFGYTNVIVSGGDGTAQSSGGGGGSVVLRQRQPALEPSTEVAAYGPGGAVINYASVFANGGAGAQAGNAGAVQLSTQTNVAFGDSFEVVLNFGDIDATGGVASDTACGTGGELRMSAIAGVQNSGTIDVSAGVSPPGIDAGCSSGDVELVGLAGPVQNTGAISNDGGAGKIGSAGGQVSLLGAGVTNGATISCDGGDGIDFGGSGGGITLFASPTGASTNTGALSAAGGTGTIIGSNGVIEIDGTIVGS